MPINSADIKKILIIHVAGLGDLIMLLPALRVLKENFPGSRIDIFLGQPIAAGILNEGELVHKIMPFDVNKSSLFEKLRFIYKLRRESYDLSIVTTGANPFKGGIFSFLIGAKERAGESKNQKRKFYQYAVPVDKTKHIAECDLNLLRAIGLRVGSVLPFVPFVPGRELSDFADNFIKNNGLENKILIGFFPSSSEGQKFKRWPLENFVQLGWQIISSFNNAAILIFGGDKDRECCLELQNKFGENSFILIGYDLKQASALIDRCKVFVTSDTGLGHIAATTNTSLVSIFGPTDPKLSKPLGPRVHIIEEKCSRPYDFRDPGDYDINRKHRCLDKISPDRVFAKIKEILTNE